MKKTTFIKSLGVSLALMTLSTTALAEELDEPKSVTSTEEVMVNDLEEGQDIIENETSVVDINEEEESNNGVLEESVENKADEESDETVIDTTEKEINEISNVLEKQPVEVKEEMSQQEYEEIVKKNEDEISSWVDQGYISIEEEELYYQMLHFLHDFDPEVINELVLEGILTQEEADQLIELLNEMDSIEYMDFVMGLLRDMIFEEDLLEDNKEIETPKAPVVVPTNTNPKNEPKQELVQLKATSEENNTLPKTGESTKMTVSVIGLLLISALGFVYYRKKA